MSLFRSLFTKSATSAEAEATNPASDDELMSPQERRRRDRVNAREGTRVLIIDDSPTIVAALKKILVSAGYSTREALDAESGLELARQEKPELIFLDIVLPGMNGFAALRMMRRDPLTQHIPIIMISGNEQATEQFYANRIGADDFMKKPFSRSEVFARIAPLLDGNMVPRRRGLPEEHQPTYPDQAAPAMSSLVSASAPAEAREYADVAGSRTSVTPQTTAIPMQPQVPVPSAPLETPRLVDEPISSGPSPLEARKELTAMGLLYFDQRQFTAAIQRGDKLAFELFVAGGGVDIAAETDGKTPLQIARENGRTQIFALLRAQLSANAAQLAASSVASQ